VVALAQQRRDFLAVFFGVAQDEGEYFVDGGVVEVGAGLVGAVNLAEGREHQRVVESSGSGKTQKSTTSTATAPVASTPQ
jgi:hypothetical protein